MIKSLFHTRGVFGTEKPHGNLSIVVIQNKPRTSVPGKELSLPEIVRHGFPVVDAPEFVRAWRTKNIPHLFRGLKRILLARSFNLPHFYGQLSIVKIDGKTGLWTDLGLASLRVVTTAGVNFIVDAFQNTVEVENLKYHGIGTGSTAEASGDTALVTELTTEYNPNSTRATGSTIEGAAANVYRTVGTNTLDSGNPVLREHGVFSASSAGTLLDRTVYAAVTLDGAAGDALQTTYDLTFVAGS